MAVINDALTDPLPSLLDSYRVLAGVRRMRRANGWSVLKMRSPRRLMVIASVVMPGAAFLFLGLAIAMAITFGRAGTQGQSETLLSTLLMVSFATSLAGCLSTALQSLFLSSDVRFLVSLPIPVRVIYFDRFGEVARGAIPGGLFGMAICLGYVLGRAEQFRFVLFGFVGVSLLCATAISLAATVTALAIRLSSPQKTRPVLISISLGLLLLTSVGWRLFGSSASSADSHPVGRQVLSFLPSGWAREALVRAVGQNPGTALPFVALQVGMLMLISGIGASAFATTFAGNIERTELTSVRISRRRSSPIGRRILGLVPHQFVHWVKREWLLIGRDFSRVSAAILPIGSVFIWMLMSLMWSQAGDRSGAANFWMTHSPVLLLPWGISLGTTVFAFGCEGRGIDLLRSLPIRPSLLIWGKYLAYFIPIFLISESMALLSIVVRSGSSRDVWMLFVLTGLLSATFCAVDISMAAIAPRFDRDHVQRSTGFFARIAAAAGGLLVAAVLVTAVSLSPIGDSALLTSLGADEPTVSATVWLTLAIVGLALPVALLMLSVPKMARWLRTG
jgi:Putative ATP-binding cassette